MARSTDKTYTEVVTVAMSPGQKKKLDARVTASMNRSDIIRAALDAYLGEAISDSGSPGPTADEIADAVADRLGMGQPSEPPDGWTVAGINVGALGQLRERGELDLAQALEIVLKAAESGEVAPDDVVRIVTASARSVKAGLPREASGETCAPPFYTSVLHYLLDAKSEGVFPAEAEVASIRAVLDELEQLAVKDTPAPKGRRSVQQRATEAPKVNPTQKQRDRLARLQERATDRSLA